MFLMKMGPTVPDPSAVLCKPAYGGNVYLYYSLDGGGVWETLSILETFSFRKETFTEVCEVKYLLRLFVADVFFCGVRQTDMVILSEHN